MWYKDQNSNSENNITKIEKLNPETETKIVLEIKQTEM